MRTTNDGKIYEVVFRTYGFVPENLDDWEWEKFKGFYAAMHNTFTELFNTKLGQINSIWNAYERIKISGNEDEILLTEMLMDIGSDATYGDWMAKWMEEIAYAVDKTYTPYTGLMGHIFRDGDDPVYGVRFLKHPSWTMDLILK